MKATGDIPLNTDLLHDRETYTLYNCRQGRNTDNIAALFLSLLTDTKHFRTLWTLNRDTPVTNLTRAETPPSSKKKTLII